MTKKMSFVEIKDDEIKFVKKKLNDRPRKLLKYKTPYEVFYEYSNK